MENKYPPLPSNYVSFAQLQERWLKQKELEKANEKEEQIKQEKEKGQQIKQEQEQQKQHPKLHQYNPRQHRQPQLKGHQRAWRVVQTDVVDENGRHKKFASRNRNSSRSNRLAVGEDCEKRQSSVAKTYIEDENAGSDGRTADCEKRDSLEAKTYIGNENAGSDGTRRERKKKEGKKVTRKPREDKEGKKVTRKPREGKEGKKVTGKPREDKEENKSGEGAAQSTMKDDKMVIKSELNNERNNLTVVIEEKLENLSMNSVSDKQNGRLRGHDNYRSFHGCQPNYGGRFREQHVQTRQRGEKMVWVRKNEDSAGSVGVIEVAGGT